jgi:hypothetical protein
VPALAFGIVIEGVFELVLDGGEARRMYPGDTFIQRGTFHVVRNPLSDKSCRMVFALLDAEPLIVNGTAVKTDMGFHSKEYHEK